MDITPQGPYSLTNGVSHGIDITKVTEYGQQTLWDMIRHFEDYTTSKPIRGNIKKHKFIKGKR